MPTAVATAAPFSRFPSPIVPVLSVAGASKTYLGRRRVVAAFASLSFEVGSSEIVALLGASGCGKSSLLKAVAGLEPIDTGDILLRGRPLTGPDPAVGFVFQEPVLFPWLSVEANVALSLELRHSPPLTRAERLARVCAALADVGLGDLGAAATRQLSGGMAQRVALARALVREPALLLLDEPFGALDAITRMEMQRLLLKVVAARRAAVLLVTHDLDEALLLADRVLLMAPAPGRIIGEWSVTTPRPRFERSVELAPLRVELLGALSRTLAP